MLPPAIAEYRGLAIPTNLGSASVVFGRSTSLFSGDEDGMENLLTVIPHGEIIEKDRLEKSTNRASAERGAGSGSSSCRGVWWRKGHTDNDCQEWP